MKILDRYIIQTFVVSFLIVLLAMMGLTLLLDLFFNVNDFLSLASEAKQVGFWGLLGEVLDYYFFKSFDYFQLLASRSLVVAAAATLVRFNRSREITSLKAAGISLYRIMWPMIVVGIVVDGLFIVNQEILIPMFSARLTRSPGDLVVQDTFPVEFVRDENNNIIYAPVFNPKTQEMLAEPKQLEQGAILFWARVRIFLRGKNYEARGTIEAEKAAWDARQGCWRLTNGVRLPPMKEADLLERMPTGPEGDPVDVYFTNVGPTEIQRHRAGDFHRFMSYGELRALAEDPMRGNRRQLQVSMHEHITMPILNILMLLLGLPFVAGREDRNYFASIGIAIGLGIGVFVISFTSTAFGNTGHIGPLLAAWIPVFIVLPASVLAMESLRT